MQVVETIFGAISKGVAFLRRQHHDWKITVARTSLFRFNDQMLFPYLSIYIVALGASATQLGIVNSAGMATAGLAGPLIGWLIDKIGAKTLYLLGIGFLAVSYFTYGIAQSWPIIIVAMLAYWLGQSTSIHSCATICGNCLTNEDRATGMAICESVAAGLLGMAGPMLGALLVTNFGGVNIGGIRPLFFVCVAVTIGTFILILVQLSNRKWGELGRIGTGFFRDFSQIFKEGRYLKRWMVIVAIGQLPLGMVLPFSQLFAYEVKGADQYVLGAMVTGAALTSLVLGIPMGMLADKFGRKKVLYCSIPLFWVSNLILIWAPSPALLIAAGVLQGFFFINGPLAAAMERELVPPEQMGRWLGITRLCRMLLAAGLAYVAGIIWDSIGPQYVFLMAIGLDLFIRIPLLIGMPETLGLKIGVEQRE